MTPKTVLIISGPSSASAMGDWPAGCSQMLFFLRVQPQFLLFIILTSFFPFSFSTLYLPDEGSQAGGRMVQEAFQFICLWTTPQLHRGTPGRLRGLLISDWARAKGNFLRNSKVRGKSQLYLHSTEVRADHWQQPVGHLPRAQNVRGTITSLGVYQDGKKTVNQKLLLTGRNILISQGQSAVDQI